MGGSRQSLAETDGTLFLAWNAVTARPVCAVLLRIATAVPFQFTVDDVDHFSQSTNSLPVEAECNSRQLHQMLVIHFVSVDFRLLNPTTGTQVSKLVIQPFNQFFRWFDMQP